MMQNIFSFGGNIISRFGLQYILVIMIMVGILVDFLGINRAMDRITYNITARILSAFYPWHFCGHANLCFGDRARHEIAVIFIDDDFLAGSPGGTWPVPWSRHVKLLNRLGEARPQLVFLDLLFARRPSTDDVNHLEAAMRRLQAGGARIVLGEVQYANSPERLCADLSTIARGSTLPELACAADALGGVQWVETDYPSIYPVETRDNGKPGALPTAAFAIQNLLYPFYEAPAPLSPMASALMMDRGLLMSWGVRLPRRVGPAQDGGLMCGDYARDLAFWERVLINLLPLINLPGAPEDKVCPYANTYSAGAVMREDDLLAALKGKIVLVGTAFTGDRDVVLGPLQNQVPGVLLHAMALDNLLTFGPRTYPEITEYQVLGPVKLHTVLFIGSLYLGGWLERRMQHLPVPTTPQHRRRARCWALLLLVLVTWLGLLSLPHLLMQICLLALVTPAQHAIEWCEKQLLGTARSKP